MRGAPDPGCDNDNVPPTPAQQARAAAIAAEISARLAGVGFALPGTLADRMTRCGYPGCRCRADPPRPHGPYHQWTRKKVAGFWRRGVPAKLGWGVAASGHGPALLATGVLPVRRAGAVTGSRVADGGSVV